MSTGTDSTLTINLNEEYKIKIEEGKDFYTSFFKDVYEAALKNVEEIITQSSPDNKYDDFNNIIAFTGERGKGKSSSMISFRDALVGNKDPEHREFFRYSRIINSNQFVTIDIVDPSLFRGGESLFEIILAQMFEKFQTEIKKSETKLNDDDRRSIIKHFKEVFDNLQIIKSDRKELYKKESIESLSRLATSSNLRRCFKELVGIYLEKFEKLGNKNGYLVIAIDDFDLNISAGYDMLEDIRQFLIQSKIILLISCKIEQLKQIVLNNNIKSYEYIRKNMQSEISDSDLLNKTEKYLEKLLPQHRKILLPNISLKTSFTIIYLGTNEELNQVKLEEILNDKYLDLRRELINERKLFIGTNHTKLILETIYKKNSFFINIPELRQNSIIPDTLRGVIDFISTLKSSDSLDMLKKHILDIIANNFCKDYILLFESLENQSAHTLNLAVIKLLAKIKENHNSTNQINEFLAVAKNPLLVTVGDVYTVLKDMYNSVDYVDKKNLLFIDLLNIYYSLRLKTDCNITLLNPYLYISEYLKVFRSSSARVKNKTTYIKRDYVEFTDINVKNLFENIIDESYKLWFIHFFVFLGKVNRNYRESLDNPFYRSYQNVSNGTFSPLAIFSNILNTEKLAYQINISNIDQLDLYKDIQQWNNNTYIISESHDNNENPINKTTVVPINNLSCLFNNSMFFLELMNIWEDEINKYHKDGVTKTEEGNEENFFDTISSYFLVCLEKALNRMKIKYDYLEINASKWIEHHPIIKRFKLIKENINLYETFLDIFNKIYLPSTVNIKYNHHDINNANKVLSEYSDYFENDQINNVLGTKSVMTKLIKTFTDDNIKNELTSYRKIMNKDFISGLNNIKDLLIKIANG